MSHYCPRLTCQRHRPERPTKVIGHGWFQGPYGRRRRYRCLGCGGTFSSRVGTALASAISLRRGPPTVNGRSTERGANCPCPDDSAHRGSARCTHATRRPHLGGEEIRRGEHVPVGADKLLPRGGLLALRRGGEVMAFQDITDRLVAHRVAEVGQGPDDTVVARVADWKPVCDDHHSSCLRRTVRSEYRSRRPSGPRAMACSLIDPPSSPCTTAT